MSEEKKSFKNVLAKILLILLGIVVIAYLIFNTIRLVASPADTYVVEKGVLNLKENTEAYVIRNEIVLQGTNYKNGMEKVVTEGKRVAKGEPVFRYYVNGESTIKSEIAELDKKIAEAQKNENTIYNTDIEVLKGRIKDLEEKIYQSNNIEEINNYKKEIDDYSYKISTIMGGSSQSSPYLKELVSQKTAYLNKLTDGAEEIKSDYSGTISYRIDNLENVFTANDFSYLKKSFLDGLNLRTGQLIETSNEKGKVITEFACYLAIEMNSDAAKSATVGSKVKIELDVDSRFNAEIVAINEDDDCRIIVFKINDLQEKLINYRKIAVSVIWWETTGLKVPNSALIDRDGKKYVQRNRAGYSAEVLVKVLQQNDSYAIVDNYSSNELQEMGYSSEEIQNRYTIKQYDKINIKNK